MKMLIKKIDPVIMISMILAIISSYIIGIDSSYIDYIDYQTISILFCLMLIMEGLKCSGFLINMGNQLLEKTNNKRSLSIVLLLLAFITAPLMTNDVALIVFVPFTMTVLQTADMKEDAAFIIIMQTILANLGSMITPFGNPQNLYLYMKSNISFVDFIEITYVYALSTIIIALVLVSLKIKNGKLSYKRTSKIKIINMDTVIYLSLFILVILSVVQVVNYLATLVIVSIVIIIKNKTLFKTVDYALIGTFLFLFIFIGNISRIDEIASILGKYIENNEFFTSIICSQVISNVPTAVLLSGFTKNWKELIVGVNIGGLGTLIASMASLISYKLYTKEFKTEKSSYILKFTTLNILFLVIMVGVYVVK